MTVGKQAGSVPEAATSRLGVPPDPAQDPEVESVFAAIRARGGRLLNIQRTLSHSPRMLKAQATYAATLRNESSIARPVQQLAIIRVCQLNQGAYELSVHHEATRALGVAQAKIDAVETWQQTDLFDETERIALAFVEQAARDGIVDEPTFQTAQERFGRRGVVDLAALVAWYVGNTRFTRALAIACEGEVR